MYTYFTRNLRVTTDALADRKKIIIREACDPQGWDSDRFGGRVEGSFSFEEPLTPEDMIAYRLCAGVLPEATVIESALESGEIYPTFCDGLLCSCKNYEHSEGIEIESLSLPGNFRSVAQFWDSGVKGAARAVYSMLWSCLPDDELADRVVRLIKSIGGRPERPDAHSIELAARMSEVAASPELAALAS